MKTVNLNDMTAEQLRKMRLKLERDNAKNLKRLDDDMRRAWMPPPRQPDSPEVAAIKNISWQTIGRLNARIKELEQQLAAALKPAKRIAKKK